MFTLRQKIKWKGLTPKETGPSTPPTERGQWLYEAYEINRWSPQLSRKTLDDILGTLDLLDRGAKEISPSLAQSHSKIYALDIGAKNWRYAGALVAWLEKNYPHCEIHLAGVELDAYYFDSTLRTRLGLGEYFSKILKTNRTDLQYLAQDVREYTKPAHLISWFFPFLDLNPHVKWGLPKNLYNPSKVSHHVESLLETGGTLIMANQGEWEWESAQKQFQTLKLKEQILIQTSLHACSYPIYLSKWEKV